MNSFQSFTSSDVIVFAFAGLLVIFLLIGFILYFVFSYRHKQRDFNLLQTQKKLIDDQNIQLENTLSELKAMQSQLIQSEKMASLGELTAGIAHEIQNPLNFVNNFSEVSAELIKELRAEALKNHTERSFDYENEILNDLEQNLGKINVHGQRADAIVKSMLQHSRKNNGQSELTDINNLCDNFLRISYNGFKAKDLSFKAELKTVFDEKIGKINMIPQDIGRVFLNIFNNAFYAVNEKQKMQQHLMDSDNYQPTVAVETHRERENVVIKIWDNGNGIPPNIIGKVFQPFFTTKPAGQGTGLGLSLSYDILKAGGGDIKVESREDMGTTFSIYLPAR